MSLYLSWGRCGVAKIIKRNLVDGENVQKTFEKDIKTFSFLFLSLVKFCSTFKEKCKECRKLTKSS